jgi:AcrR family transcriptional regulator
MRSDARSNIERIMTVAREVVAVEGANASLRDIARRAGVGLGTLYRHFPSREALLEALLRETFDALRDRAEDLQAEEPAAVALRVWLRDFVRDAHTYRDVSSLMIAAIEDEDSALHDSCVTMRAAGARLLANAQAVGAAKSDMDGTDLFALVGALAWLADQPGMAERTDHLFEIVAGSILVTSENSPTGTEQTGSDPA